jgi:small GTP-binding protein
MAPLEKPQFSKCNLHSINLFRYSEKQFTESHMATIGLDCVSTTYAAPSGRNVMVKIWDTAGQERFRSITETFYRQANGVIVVFDISNALSFANVKTWLESIHQHAERGIYKVLVGNKCDLEDERKVSKDEAETLANLYKLRYFETSAKNNENVDELINFMIEKVY